MRFLVLGLMAALALVGCNTTDNQQSGKSVALTGKSAKAYSEYSDTGNFRDFKAFHYDSHSRNWGRSWGFYTPEAAIKASKEFCVRQSKRCELYALGDTVVFGKGAEYRSEVIEQYRKKHSQQSIRDAGKNRNLSGIDINTEISGRIFKGKTFAGQEYILTMHRSGELSVRLLNIKAKVRTWDKGKWWVTGGKICRQLSFFFSGEKECFSVRSNNGGYQLINGSDKVVSHLKTTGVTSDAVTASNETVLGRGSFTRLISGNKVVGTTVDNKRLSFEFLDLGHERYLYVQELGEYGNITKNDRGTWWFKQGKLCRELGEMFNGKTVCSSVTKKNEEYAFKDTDGDVAYRFKVVGKIGETNTNKPKVAAKTNTGFSTAWKKKNAMAVGTMVGYSELCSAYQGASVSRKILQNIKDFFDNDKVFLTGYDKFASHRLADQVSGLHQCDAIKKGLESIGKQVLN